MTGLIIFYCLYIEVSERRLSTLEGSKGGRDSAVLVARCISEFRIAGQLEANIQAEHVVRTEGRGGRMRQQVEGWDV